MLCSLLLKTGHLAPPVQILLSAMANQWERPDWWSRTRLPNAQEGDDRAWETRVAGGVDENYRQTAQNHQLPAAHSWDPAPTPAAAGAKRIRSESPSEEQEPSSKRLKINVTDASADEVNKSGNVVGDNVKWVSQEDPCPLGHPVTQAMWLVAEKSYDYYSGVDQTWFRPATQLSDMLEAQYQANTGCQTCVLSYPKSDGTIVKHIFEHDLRGQEWAQKRFTNESKSELRTSKKILRLMVG